MVQLLNNKTRGELINKIKKVRENKKLTQIEVASKTGMNANYYAKIERGEANASIDILLKIAKVLGIKFSDILSF